jgi:hypothetical protein
VLAPSATTTNLIHDDWHTLILFTESDVNVPVAVEEHSRWVTIGRHTSRKVSGIVIRKRMRDMVPFAPSNLECGVQLVNDQEKILQTVRRSLRAAVFALRCIRFKGRCYDLCNRRAKVCRHSRPNPQLEWIPVTGLATVATCET